MRASTRVLDGGKVTVPIPVREHLNLEKGDFVHIDVTPVPEDPEAERKTETLVDERATEAPVDD